jgi:hypothetical protein
MAAEVIPTTIAESVDAVTRLGYAPRVVSVVAKPGVWASITIAPIGPLLEGSSLLGPLPLEEVRIGPCDWPLGFPAGPA